MLVHGAFAESSRWDQVIDPLLDAGYPVTAVANPLRALASGAACVRSIEGPVLLVAHPYGGAVMTNAPEPAGPSRSPPRRTRPPSRTPTRPRA